MNIWIEKIKAWFNRQPNWLRVLCVFGTTGLLAFNSQLPITLQTFGLFVSLLMLSISLIWIITGLLQRYRLWLYVIVLILCGTNYFSVHYANKLSDKLYIAQQKIKELSDTINLVDARHNNDTATINLWASQYASDGKPLPIVPNNNQRDLIVIDGATMTDMGTGIDISGRSGISASHLNFSHMQKGIDIH